MAVFADRGFENFGTSLPLLCPIATFPHTLAEFVAPNPLLEEMISSINDVFTHSSIDLASIFSSAREAENPPTLDEYSALQDLITQCKEDIEVLDAKIPQTLKTIINLCCELRETSLNLIRKRDRVSMAKYIISPPKHLPHDILERIFLTSWESLDSSGPRPHLTPLRLAGVCHRWRSVALSTPKLWSRIYVVMTDPTSIEIAKLCMSRSHTISLTVRNGDHATLTSRANDFLEFLANSSIRISHLSMPCVDENLRKGVDAVIARHAKSAEELVLFVHWQEDIDAPNIKRLYICGLPGSWQLQQGPNPLPRRFSQFLNLTVLCFQWVVPWQIIYLILDSCSELRSLSACITQADNLDTTSHNLRLSGGTVHPHLEYLAIGPDYYAFIPEDFLHHYAFPKLRMFGYEFRQSEQPHTVPWLISHPFLTQINQLVLSFTDSPPERDILTSLFQSSHSVRKLNLSGVCRMPGILKTALEVLLASVSTTTMLAGVLPQLQEVQILSDVSFTTTYGSYEENVRALLQAWSKPTATSSTAPELSSDRRRVEKLIIKCRCYSFPQYEDEYAKKLLSIGNLPVNDGDTSEESRWVPEVQVHREKYHFGSRTNGFETWPLPFDESPWFEVLKEDGSWEERM